MRPERPKSPPEGKKERRIERYQGGAGGWPSQQSGKIGATGRFDLFSFGVRLTCRLSFVFADVSAVCRCRSGFNPFAASSSCFVPAFRTTDSVVPPKQRYKSRSHREERNRRRQQRCASARRSQREGSDCRRVAHADIAVAAVLAFRLNGFVGPARAVSGFARKRRRRRQRRQRRLRLHPGGAAAVAARRGAFAGRAVQSAFGARRIHRFRLGRRRAPHCCFLGQERMGNESGLL